MSFVDLLRHLMPGARDAVESEEPKTGSKSHDKALSAFKADLAKRAEKNTRHIPGEWQSRRT